MKLCVAVAILSASTAAAAPGYSVSARDPTAFLFSRRRGPKADVRPPKTKVKDPSPVELKNSYLDFMGAGPPPPPEGGGSMPQSGGSGMGNYLDSVGSEAEQAPPPPAYATAPPPAAGTGPSSYLDNINEVCAPAAATAGESNEKCAGAITDYLDALSAGAVQPTRSAGAGISSYLDTVAGGGGGGGMAGSGPASYLDSVGSADAPAASAPAYAAPAPAAPTPVAAAPSPTTEEAVGNYLEALSSGAVAAPSAPAVKSYLDDLGSGSVAPPSSGSSISSYLDVLGGGVAAAAGGGQGAPSYLDAINEVCAPSYDSNGDRTQSDEALSEACGAIVDGVPSYLDSALSEVCDGDAPTKVCAPAITSYLDALSSGAAVPTTVGAAAITSYLGSISAGHGTSTGGAGIPSYQDGLSGINAPAAPSSSGPDGTGAAVVRYLSALADGSVEAPSTPDVKNYLDALGSGNIAQPTPGGHFEIFGVKASSAGSGMPAYHDGLAGGVGSGGGGDGIPSYLETMHEVVDQTYSVGAVSEPKGSIVDGVPSYLDSALSEACDANRSTQDCVPAIGSYLDALSSGAAVPTTVGATAITGYLDSISGGAATSTGGAGIPSYHDALDGASPGGESSGPAVVRYLSALADGSVEAPSVPDIKNYLDALSSGGIAPPSSEGHFEIFGVKASSEGSGMPAYHDALAGGVGSGSGGAGIPSYLDTISEVCAPSYKDSAEVAEACDAIVDGVPNYLDSTVSEVCDGDAPTKECAPALTNYLDALSSGAAVPTSLGAAAITSYLDSISGGAATSSGGGGMATYHDALGGGAAVSTGGASTAAAVVRYLHALSDGSIDAPSEPAVKSYLDDLSTGDVAPPTSGSSISDYLDVLSGGEAVSAGGGGIPVYHDALADGASYSTGGGGIPSYLDAMNEVCDPAVAAPVECAGAITDYLDALSLGAVTPTPVAGAGIASYLDSITPAASASAPASGQAVHSYLDDLSSGAISAPSQGEVQSYIADLSSGEVPAPVQAAQLFTDGKADTFTETTMTTEGKKTIVTITSTTKISLPPKKPPQ